MKRWSARIFGIAAGVALATSYGGESTNESETSAKPEDERDDTEEIPVLGANVEVGQS